MRPNPFPVYFLDNRFLPKSVIILKFVWFPGWRTGTRQI